MRWFLLLFIGTTHCVINPSIDTSTVQGAFLQAERFQKQGRYEEAQTQFRSIKTKHPYSSLAVEAELRIADVYFERKLWVEAEAAYKLFRELHPQFDRMDYVVFRMAMSVFNQLPRSVDRDIHLADQAIVYFDKVVENYPGSKFYKRSKEKKMTVKKMQAQKQMYIADFYFTRQVFISAYHRYVHVLEKYPNLGYDLRALFGVIVSAYKNEDLDQAKHFLKKMMLEFPQSEELARVKEITKL